MYFRVKKGSQIRTKQARKCDVGNRIFSKSYEFLEKLFGNFMDFWGIFWSKFFGGFFWEKFFGRIFWEGFFGRNSLFTLELTCLSKFWFLSRSWGNKEGSRIFNP